MASLTNASVRPAGPMRQQVGGVGMTSMGVDLQTTVTPTSESTKSSPSAESRKQRNSPGTRILADADDLLVSNLAVVERIIAFVSRRYRLSTDEAEEFGSVVRLRLVEDDYAIVRKFEGRSSFSAYLSVVVQRLLLDHRIQLWGKWHPSAEARHSGELAIELEKLLRRDGRSFDDAVLILQKSASITREQLQRIAERLPDRPPKRRTVSLEEARAAGIEATPVLAYEQQQLSQNLSTAVREFLRGLEPIDRLAMQLRFEAGMTVADTARSLQIDQRKLYRRIEAHLRDLRRSLESQGIAAEEAASLIGETGVVLDFRIDEVHT